MGFIILLQYGFLWYFVPTFVGTHTKTLVLYFEVCDTVSSNEQADIHSNIQKISNNAVNFLAIFPPKIKKGARQSHTPKKCITLLCTTQSSLSSRDWVIEHTFFIKCIPNWKAKYSSLCGCFYYITLLFIWQH